MIPKCSRSVTNIIAMLRSVKIGNFFCNVFYLTLFSYGDCKCLQGKLLTYHQALRRRSPNCATLSLLCAGKPTHMERYYNWKQ